MKLASLSLQNFQIHKTMEVGFAAGITTIIGPTDTGKSAILRALRWMCLNDFSGDDFITYGEKRTEVILICEPKIDDDFEIRRIKSKGGGSNTYELNGAEFKSFSTSVPDTIQSLLKLSSLNFQGQFDAPFWFAESAGSVSRQLNAIIDLSVIDTTLSNISHEVRRVTESKSIYADRLQKAELELEDLEWQERRVNDFKSLKDANQKVVQIETEEETLSNLLSQVDANRASSLLQQAKEGNEVLESARRLRTDIRDSEDLRDLINEGARLLKSSTPPPDFDSIGTTFSTWSDLCEDARSLDGMIKVITTKASLINVTKAGVKQEEETFHKKIKGKLCPLCNQLQS